ncbi:hypothetical protein [Mycobacterium sp. 1423905.2]|uniref:hypothetical protein n=1 Tax=Mycobacterium sp. 1423905.2 TaxID=1856859 RepID=UPI0007FFACB8|nr:hypothetical protein [Mycobacterium sp. 1423905.2]OBJ58191.1 hypothetical protein A9W95_11990 [Mycobacterium sp. 1423905.2]
MAAVGALDVVNDVGPARWLTESAGSFAENVGSLVPASFAAYARVLHPAFDHQGGERRRVSWAQIARANRKVVHPQMQFARLLGYTSRYDSGYRPEQPGLLDEAPAVGTLPPNIAASLARTLARHTMTTDRCWFAVWHGHAALDPAFHDGSTFSLPGRNYHLARGPLAAASQSLGIHQVSHLSANLWWPDDHAWCVATEIDLDSTYLGASQACIEELAADSELEVMPLSVTAGVTADSDTLNPATPRGFPRSGLNPP